MLKIVNLKLYNPTAFIIVAFRETILRVVWIMDTVAGFGKKGRVRTFPTG